MDDLARRQAELTARYRLAARALYESVQRAIAARSFERDQILELLDQAATTAAELAPADQALAAVSAERLAAARAEAAAAREQQWRQEAEARAAARARDRAELAEIRHREGPS